jgi:phosphatidate cytidylyltransferase
MVQRIITALVLIPLVLLLILRAPIWLLAIVAGIVALLAIREFLVLTRRYGVEPFAVGTYIFTGLFFAALAVLAQRGLQKIDFSFFFIVVIAAILIAFAPFIFLMTGLKRENLQAIYPAAAAAVFAFSYIAIPMGLLIDMQLASGTGAFLLIYLMLVVWSGDILAYFVGKSIGRHKMSPQVSPKKTWEGAAASVLASIGFGTLLHHYSLPISQWLLSVHLLRDSGELWGPNRAAMWQVILLSAVLNIAAQLGDLVESAIKRGADVKDSGAILPGHGGMLDRIDAMLFAAPVLWLFAIWHGLP